VSSRIELEEFWRTRLKAARQRYVNSSKELQRLASEAGGGLTEHPDGAYALHCAGQRERRDLHEYARILRIFTDLVVDGKEPDETP
jgi:hypothetical protein